MSAECCIYLLVEFCVCLTGIYCCFATELPKEDANKMDAVIPFDVVDALGFLIGGSVNGNK